MSGLSSLTEFGAEFAAEYAEAKGVTSLKDAFQILGGASTALEGAFEKDPVKTGAAMLVGLTALVAFGPELAASGAITSLAGTLAAFGFESSIATALAGAAVSTMLSFGGEDLYNAVRSARLALS